MRVGIVSPFGCSVGIAARLQDEGHEVLLLNERFKGPLAGIIAKVGDGIVPLARGWDDLFEWCKEPDGPTIMLFDGSGMGEKADEARKAGLHVIGGSSFCDRMEKDRSFGFFIAEEMGADLPYYQAFSSVAAGAKYARALGAQAAYFKSDKYLSADATYGGKDGPDLAEYMTHIGKRHGDRMRHIVQDKIDGVAVSTERFFNGREFVGPYLGIIEHKKFMDGDRGPSTGCSFNAIWPYGDESELAQKLGFANLAEILRRHEAPPGIYDANAIVDEDGDAYFLEWCARFGWDSEPTGMRLFADYGRFLWYLATGQGDAGTIAEPGTIAYSVRLTVPPYPTEDIEPGHKASPVGNPVRGTDGLWAGHFVAYQIMAEGDGLAVASPEGIVGLSVAVGEKLSALGDETLAFAKDEMRVAGLQYRTDGAKVVADDAKKIRAVLTDVPEGLCR